MAERCRTCSRHGAGSGDGRAFQQHGFGLLGLLILIAILGIVAASGVQIGTLLQRRAAEEELLFVGMEFQRALASYAAASPVGAPRGPASIDDLLRDPRFPGVRRHLRRVYVDPVTGGTRWGLIRGPDGRIVAFHSLSEEPPIKQANFAAELQHLAQRSRYSEWTFGTAALARPQ